MTDIKWCFLRDTFIISPETGGMIIFWRHHNTEIVHSLEKTNGPEYSNEAVLEFKFFSVSIEPGFCCGFGKTGYLAS